MRINLVHTFLPQAYRSPMPASGIRTFDLFCPGEPLYANEESLQQNTQRHATMHAYAQVDCEVLFHDQLHKQIECSVVDTLFSRFAIYLALPNLVQSIHKVLLHRSNLRLSAVKRGSLKQVGITT